MALTAVQVPIDTQTEPASRPAAGLTQAQIAIVKSTAPVLKEHGTTITAVFYKSLLGNNPTLKNMFSLRNQQTGAQQAALANAVLAYATHIDDLSKLKDAVERIAHKHAALFVRPEQYPIVGEHLMKAIGEVLGPALTPDIADAWTAAYAQLADVFIAAERQLYVAAGRWTDWRKFKVVRKEAESPSVTSFYLAPSDGRTPLPRYLPGQYVSLQIPVPGIGLVQSRQYSLSEAPSDNANYYRVSVKREATIEDATLEDIAQGKVPGLVSNRLHDYYMPGDEVELSHPQGEFFVDVSDTSKAQTPIILMSAGVGVTPLVSILDALTSPDSKTKERPVSWIQAARNSASLCFGKHVRQVAKEHKNVATRIFLDEVDSSEVQGVDYDFDSPLDLSRLDAAEDLFVGNERAEYYVCGPVPWMLAVRRGLEDLGISRERMHLELFGTGGVPEE